MRDGAASVEPVPVDADRRITQLIEFGRDREAVLLAAASAARGTGSAMDVLQQLDELGPLLMAVVARTTDEDLARPTPCAELDVAGILGHLVTGATAFAAAFRGTGPTAGRPAPAGDAREAFGPALQELDAAIRSPGALSREVAAPLGVVSGETFARFVALDGLVHGWDIATATGQPYAPSDGLVAAVDEFARSALSNRRDHGATFADAVEPPAGATPIERLVAHTGRHLPA